MPTYAETLDFLYAQLPMFHRIGPAAFKKDLTNTLALCERLGQPQQKFPSIHVGGTNGKGSVSHMLAAICQSAGLKTGLYVSPHYKDFRERIKVNGRYISRAQVVDFVGKNREAIDQIQPSFFELCVAMAFDHFARQRVDIAIIEVGLGGRLDSTNVITPLLSVITNISYDHQNLLGDTLPQIAFEKAGIIKPGVPVVIGETHPESAPVFLEKAKKVGAPISFADQHFSVVEKNETAWQSTVYDIFYDKNLILENLAVDAAGPYLGKNVATVMEAVRVMGGMDWAALPVQAPPPTPPQALTPPPTPPPKGRGARPQQGQLPSPSGEGLGVGLKHGMGQGLKPGEDLGLGLRHALSQLRQLTRFIGRWQIIGQNPTVLCDSAHNEAGLRLAFEKINSLSFRQLHIVTGFVNDKEVDKVLPLFPAGGRYYFAKADIPRGLDAGILREKAASFGLKGQAYRSVRNALRAARRGAGTGDLVVVIGSIFVVAEVI